MVSPAVSPPTRWNYDMCTRYDDGVLSLESVGDGLTAYVPCLYDNRLSRRYVIIQIEAVSDVLSFCEIEIYTHGKLFFVLSY